MFVVYNVRHTKALQLGCLDLPMDYAHPLSMSSPSDLRRNLMGMPLPLYVMGNKKRGPLLHEGDL